MRPHPANGIGFAFCKGVPTKAYSAQTLKSAGIDGPLFNFTLLVLYVKEKIGVWVNDGNELELEDQDEINQKSKNVKIM